MKQSYPIGQKYLAGCGFSR